MPSTQGAAQMDAFLMRAMAGLRQQVAAALTAEAEIELGESQERVPVDTGVLRASAYVAPVVIDGASLRVEMGYGGAAADYAAQVHEDLDAFHPHGEAKYLEGPLRESVPFMGARLARRIDFSRVAR